MKDSPAFPQPITSMDEQLYDTKDYSPVNGGITKREYFMCKVVQGIISRGNDYGLAETVQKGYKFADEMIKQGEEQ